MASNEDEFLELFTMFDEDSTGLYEAMGERAVELDPVSFGNTIDDMVEELDHR